MRIRYRIVIPFTLLFIASYGALAAYAIYKVADAAEASIITQLKPVGRMVSMGPLSSRSFDYVKAAWNAETVIEFDDVLDRNLSTLPVDAIEKPLRAADFGAEDYAELLLSDGASYLVVRTRAQIKGPPGESNRQGWVYLFYPGAILSEQKLKATGPLVILSGLGLLGVFVMGFIIARSIAHPIEQLSDQAGRIRDLQSPLQVPTTSKEIAQLTEGLNGMLAELKASQARAMEAEKGRLMKELAASVAHEIKNPLQAIKMLIQMQPGLDAADKKMLLNEIVRIELASLELLSLETPAKLKQDRFSLARVVEDTLDLLDQQLRHLHIRVSRDLRPAEIEGDPDRIKRVVMNLILNGAQAMPKGGDLAVKLQSSGGSVRFSVTDAGGGIPDAVRARIFEPFVTTKGDGVGLGLFVTKRIVEGHRGQIGFDTQPGLTTFYFEVPCRPS